VDITVHNLNPYTIMLKLGLKIAKILGLDTIASIHKFRDLNVTANTS